VARQGGATPPRVEDLFRHLEDLRTRTYEGAEPREAREAVFRRAVELIDPVVRRVLQEANVGFLRGRGEIDHEPVHDDGAGGTVASWSLSWPEQRDAENVRGGERVGPVQVVAWFMAGFNHPHLRGSQAGNWPLQVTSQGDAVRQEPIVRAIVEAELHERIFEGTWRVIPAFVGEHGEDGSPALP
jgi:hypothetical protein